jgi:7-cyano-7-deazaguanine synthase|tara:strand:+ start:160 stop:405 length:246 start_codon:yes stop_codon:yes gene_type:complete
VETAGFDYGQRHVVELDCRPNIRAKAKARFVNWAPGLRGHHLINLNVLGQISDTVLTEDIKIEMGETVCRQLPYRAKIFCF